MRAGAGRTGSCNSIGSLGAKLPCHRRFDYILLVKASHRPIQIQVVGNYTFLAPLGGRDLENHIIKEYRWKGEHNYGKLCEQSTTSRENEGEMLGRVIGKVTEGGSGDAGFRPIVHRGRLRPCDLVAQPRNAGRGGRGPGPELCASHPSVKGSQRGGQTIKSTEQEEPES